jgi:diadenosine tetraphosphate (Ap4A) HIT family hydrolase
MSASTSSTPSSSDAYLQKATPTNEVGEPGDIMFGRFIIPQASVFYRSTSSSSTTSAAPSTTASAKSMAFVNLRPIVPGHVLVIPERIVPEMKDLLEEEYLSKHAECC